LRMEANVSVCATLDDIPMKERLLLFSAFSDLDFGVQKNNSMPETKMRMRKIRKITIGNEIGKNYE